MTSIRSAPGPQLTLQYPRAVGVYDNYLQAQQVVDYPSDQQFPVSCTSGTAPILR